MLDSDLQVVRNAAEELRRNDPTKQQALSFFALLVDIRLAEAFAVELGHDQKAEFASQAFRIFGRGLADACSTSLDELQNELDDIVEREKKGQTREEKIDALHKVGEARIQLAFDQPIKN